MILPGYGEKTCTATSSSKSKVPTAARCNAKRRGAGGGSFTAATWEALSSTLSGPPGAAAELAVAPPEQPAPKSSRTATETTPTAEIAIPCQARGAVRIDQFRS